jgi:hypothetical protein
MLLNIIVIVRFQFLQSLNIKNFILYNQILETKYFVLYTYFDGFKQAIDQIIMSTMTGVQQLTDPTMVKELKF